MLGAVQAEPCSRCSPCSALRACAWLCAAARGASCARSLDSSCARRRCVGRLARGARAMLGGSTMLRIYPVLLDLVRSLVPLVRQLERVRSGSGATVSQSALQCAAQCCRGQLQPRRQSQGAVSHGARIASRSACVFRDRGGVGLSARGRLRAQRSASTTCSARSCVWSAGIDSASSSSCGAIRRRGTTDTRSQRPVHLQPEYPCDVIQREPVRNSVYEVDGS